MHSFFCVKIIEIKKKNEYMANSLRSLFDIPSYNVRGIFKKLSEKANIFISFNFTCFQETFLFLGPVYVEVGDPR